MAHPTSRSTTPSTPVSSSPLPSPCSPSSPPSSRLALRRYREAEVAAVRHAERIALNPNIDRKIAKVNVPDDTKLVVIIQHPNSDAPTRMKYPNEVDWSDQKCISALNVWRGRILRYYFGNLSRKEPVPRQNFLSDHEKAWLLEETRKGGFHWATLAKRFNAEFEGVLLKNNSPRRPIQTGRQMEALYTKLLKKEADGSGIEDKQSYADDGIDEAGSESDLEEGEIREYPRARKLTRPWEL